MGDTWIITGGSSDLAKSLYEELDKRTEDKVTVYAQYNSRKIEGTYKNIEIVPIHADLSDEKEVASFIEQTAAGLNGTVPTHILHLAAVPYEYVRIKEWDEARTDKQMRVEVYAFAQICRSFVPKMAKAKAGKIGVMLTSAVKDEIPPKAMCEYVTAKYALMGYAKSLEAEYVEKGIGVYTFAPSMMETSFLKNIDPRIVEIDAASMPDGRHITPAEVASEILDKMI